tara:strand:- start:269 stop:649 length:381 start_codon:yes stop_codon:yes gene_type:complete
MKATALIFNSKNIKKFNKKNHNMYYNDLFINVVIFVFFTSIVGVFLLYRYNSKLDRLKTEKEQEELETKKKEENIERLEKLDINNENIINKNIKNENIINENIKNENKSLDQNFTDDLDEDKYYFL